MIEPDSIREPIPESYARPFTPLREEIEVALRLAVPRFGRSPRLAFFKVLEPCQMDCSYCDANIVTGPMMSTRAVFRVLENLSEAGVQMVDLTGGEPTLRRDLPRIVSHAHRLGMLPTVSTNGGIRKGKGVDYAYWHKMAESGMFGANISYDGVGEKSDPRVLSLASFLINTLHVYAGIRTVVTKENLDKVFEIGSTCVLNNIFYQAVPAVALGGDTSAQASDFSPLDHIGRKQLIDILAEIREIRGPFASFVRTPERYLREVVDTPNPNVAWHCTNPASHWIAVNARGDARVCNDVPLTVRHSLTGDDNPLLTRQFYDDVKRESQECGGCPWLCHWEGNRGQLSRGIDHLQQTLTIGGLT